MLVQKQKVDGWPPIAFHLYLKSRVAFGRQANIVLSFLKAYAVINPITTMNTQLLQQARMLDVNEQIELVEAIWNGIVSQDASPSLTEAQITELDRRLADHIANPDDVIGWDEVKADALAKIKR